MKNILHQIKTSYKKILKNNLVGIYLHGSFVMDCFNEEVSDLDFIVVVNQMISHKQKGQLIEVLLNIENPPKKGFEMSVVLKRYCTYFQYPTPYELHFSKIYEEYYKKDLSGMCHRMFGKDFDLAVHFKVIQEKGKVLIGRSIEEVFGCVNESAIFDSIDRDIQESVSEIGLRYDVILNMCRFAYYLYDSKIVSKKEGALWAISYFEEEYSSIILKAFSAYIHQTKFILNEEEISKWLSLMKECGVLL